MPSGPSGRSPHSRTDYKFIGLTKVRDLLIGKYGDRVDANLKRVMDGYHETMTLLCQSDIARTYRRSGQYARYVAYIAARPELARRLFSRAAMKVRKRIDRRSPTV
jgi:hypothetical protein